MNIFFTSDTHFNHTRIIELCGRPYKSVEDMNESLISNWNSVVSTDDTVYHLGDFAWRGKDGTMGWNILPRLNGIKHLIIGNHDDRIVQLHAGWNSIVSDRHMTINNIHFHLYHYPMEDWNKRYKGGIHLHGHVHSTPASPKVAAIKNRFDVGVDANNFTPISIDQILEKHVK